MLVWVLSAKLRGRGGKKKSIQTRYHSRCLVPGAQRRPWQRRDHLSTTRALLPACAPLALRLKHRRRRRRPPRHPHPPLERGRPLPPGRPPTTGAETKRIVGASSRRARASQSLRQSGRRLSRPCRLTWPSRPAGRRCASNRTARACLDATCRGVSVLG